MKPDMVGFFEQSNLMVHTFICKAVIRLLAFILGLMPKGGVCTVPLQHGMSFTVILVLTLVTYARLSTLLLGCRISAGQIIGKKYKHSSRHTLKKMC